MKKCIGIFICILLVFAAYTALAETKASIPTGAVTYNGHTYYVFSNSERYDWNDAVKYCNSLGGHLATLTSEKENTFVYQYITSMGYYSAYFGLSDADEEGTWKWVTNEKLEYQNWHEGEPNAQEKYEDYAMFYSDFMDSTWNDGSDFYNKPFICEWDELSENQNGECGDSLTWELSDGVLTISGKGEMSDFAYNNAPWVDYRDSIHTVIVKNGVTSIGTYAFFECANLTEVVLPTTIRRINEMAFGYCYALPSLELPEGLEYIEESIIYRCSSLTAITLPSTLNSMDGSFAGECPVLRNITVRPGNTSFVVENGVLFDYDKTELICHPAALSETTYTIPGTVKTIGEYAFDSSTNLVEITIPNSVNTIRACAFTDCSNLISIVIPDSVTSMEHYAFYACRNLKSIQLSNNLKRLWQQAFSCCSSLEEISLPKGFETIDDSYVFSDCTSLQKVYIPSSVTYISSGTFEGCPDVTIYGKANSYAQQFAETKGIPFVAVIEENIPVSKITLNKTKATLTRTSKNTKPTLQLTAEVKPSDATDSSVEWSSSNEKVATVDRNGKVTALKAGTAVITCTAKDGSGTTAQCKVTVKDKKVSKIKLNKSKASLTVILSKKSTLKLNATVSPADAMNKAVNWKSSDKKVATVNSKGEVTAVGYGSCKITATAKDGSGAKASCEINVTVDEVQDIDLKYSLNHEKQTATVTGPRETSIRQVMVASTVKANSKTYKVTAIAKNAFKGMKKLETFNTGKNLEEIGAGAFADCKKLTTIGVQSKNISKIGKGAFKGLTKKVTIYINSGLRQAYIKKLIKLLLNGGISQIQEIFQ